MCCNSDMHNGDRETRRRVCVFCGSKAGADAAYRAEATAMGTLLGKAGLGLVYGGAQVGLMGAVADAALAHGAEVIGVIPRSLADVEVAHQGLTQLTVVDTMHQRKALMAQEADAFVALPGAFGTLDEFFEILTWAQLGIHDKPCVMVNTAGYFDHLLRFLQVTIDQGFLKAKNYEYINVVGSSAEALDRLKKLWANSPVNHTAPGEPAP
jgi:uncharacterized protein (TIGR00730 family)